MLPGIITQMNWNAFLSIANKLCICNMNLTQLQKVLFLRSTG